MGESRFGGGGGGGDVVGGGVVVEKRHSPPAGVLAVHGGKKLTGGLAAGPNEFPSTPSPAILFFFIYPLPNSFSNWIFCILRCTLEAIELWCSQVSVGWGYRWVDSGSDFGRERLMEELRPTSSIEDRQMKESIIINKRKAAKREIEDGED